MSFVLFPGLHGHIPGGDIENNIKKAYPPNGMEKTPKRPLQLVLSYIKHTRSEKGGLTPFLVKLEKFLPPP